jgi:hypothetical protein
LRPDLRRSDLGAGSARPSDDGGLEEFRGFCRSRARSASTSATQLLKLTLAGLQLRPERGGLGVLGPDHLTQPGIGRPQRRDLIRDRRDIGHEP